MLISIVGAGYVGLVTAACLARLGNEVRVVEHNGDRVDDLRRGILPIREPGLDELVAEGVATDRLSFHADPGATHGTRLVIIAVGTLDDAGEWTATSVAAATEAIARDPDAPRSIVIRSTLMPGTARGIAATARAIDPRVEVALNPEFTREATAIDDFMRPDRVVIGVSDPHTDAAAAGPAPGNDSLATDLRRLYAPLGAPIVVTDLTSAETIKLASNVFLAAKITFANELARLCAATGADVSAVVDGMGMDRRIGRSFLSPGPGFGGSCFPSQARALPELTDAYGVRAPLIGAITDSNEAQADWLIDCFERESGEAVDGRRVALLGLTFKAGTDDLRDSPALRLAARLVQRGARVAAYDPAATDAGRALLFDAGTNVEGSGSVHEACAGADVVFVATEWPEFGEIEWRRIGPTMRKRWIVDARSVIDRTEAAEADMAILALGVRVPGKVGVVA
jgi:UDPglucose 6-dehydrogenase